MSDESDFDEPRPRSMLPRVGICLLNFITPGLGLVRLSRWRAGLVAFSTSLIVLAVLQGVFAWGAELDATGYIAMVGTVFAFSLLILSTTVWMSWRWSNEPAFHPYWYSRWYAILGVWFVVQAALWPLPDWLRSYYHPYYAPSVSMAPSIEQQDRFIAHMRDYDPIKRGDVVIMTARKAEYVKRIAGIPGDRIAMRDGVVVLNGVAVGQFKIGTETRSLDGESPAPFARLREQFPGEKAPHEILDSGPEQYDDTDEIRLGPNQYFLLGDNRDHSADSRVSAVFSGLGVVDRNRITGRVLFRVWRNGLQPAAL